jgi:hypothetical protein
MSLLDVTLAHYDKDKDGFLSEKEVEALIGLHDSSSHLFVRREWFIPM